MLTPERRAELYQLIRKELQGADLDFALVLLRQLQDAEHATRGAQQ